MILYNDLFLKKEEVHISHEDRGYYFGDGVYEVFRIYNGQLFEKEKHFQRLQRSCEQIKLKLPSSVQDIDLKLSQLIQKSFVQEGTLYLQITRGVAQRSHLFPKNPIPTLLAYCNEVKRPLDKMKSGIKAITQEDIRWLRCDIKSLNLLPNTLAKQNAVEQNADETIFHRNGIITECSSSNIMIVQDGEILTHPANHLILEGVTRSVVLKIAAEEGFTIREKAFDKETLKNADEVFITGTTVEITPIINIDHHNIANGLPGTVTKKLQQLFEKIVPE
ncbi:D-amino-acid transaminase [Chengkuizengella axinellae]|uniref:D-alanine aminotransferase n=1 Tax=Chengkuizengella axinellae TaxID=3064388 RepID=A0ABT9J0T2_9BACL|nr:D-amino-acid transaminase [Chengkuizengella sp. 2205SS18-9]MDP5274619.1 D-amino-acid transaminase [Chengkuizengella sp. 2205SS18-9]